MNNNILSVVSMKKIIFVFSLILVMSSITLAQELTSIQDIRLEINGICKEYNVTLTATGIDEACYDVKIDLTSPDGIAGSIFDPREGWKSSFYYIGSAFCTNETISKTFKMRTDSASDILNFQAKFRFGSSDVWSSGYYEFRQSCPAEQTYDTSKLVLAALVVILILLMAVTFYVKPVKRMKK